MPSAVHRAKPELVAAVGEVAIASAELERRIDMVTQIWSKLPEEDYRFFVPSSVSITRKIDALEHFGTKALPGKARRQALLDLIRRIRALNIDRVAVIHGDWRSQGQDGFTLAQLFGVEPVKEIEIYHAAKRQRVTAKRLLSLASDIEGVTSELIKFWFARRPRKSNS